MSDIRALIQSVCLVKANPLRALSFDRDKNVHINPICLNL